MANPSLPQGTDKRFECYRVFHFKLPWRDVAEYVVQSWEGTSGGVKPLASCLVRYLTKKWTRSRELPPFPKKQRPGPCKYLTM